jgi:hypothetical protein
VRPRQSLGYRYESRSVARQNIFEYREVFCTRIRRHSALNYRPSLEYEKRHMIAERCVREIGEDQTVQIINILPKCISVGKLSVQYTECGVILQCKVGCSIPFQILSKLKIDLID